MQYKTDKFCWILQIVFALVTAKACFQQLQPNSFGTIRQFEVGRRKILSKQDDNDNEDAVLDSEALFLERYKRRVSRDHENDSLRRPPNPCLGPAEFVIELLKGLRRVHHPITNAGVQMLHESSTPKWRNSLCYSIGKSPPETSKEELITCLSLALERPNHQFGILIGNSDVEYTIEEEEVRSNMLDYEDGTCWLETRLRNPKNNELLAVVGWSLVYQSEKSYWLLDAIDWQDFRPDHRPGIGREEWERICG